MINLTFKQVVADFKQTRRLAKKAENARMRSLLKVGGFIRTTARRSMKPGKGKSPPGQPPKSHQGALKNLLLFAWDNSSKSVVIGPTLLTTKRVYGPTTPALEERGGSVTRPIKLKRGVITTRTYKYPPRPYMGPALEIADRKGIIPEQFRDTIRN